MRNGTQQVDRHRVGGRQGSLTYGCLSTRDWQTVKHESKLVVVFFNVIFPWCHGVVVQIYHLDQ